MRHRKAGKKLNRNSSHRNAMFRNMVTSLFKYDRIRTTDIKAKELRMLADHLVTLAKRGDLHARRQALSIVREKDVVHKLFEKAGERFGAIAGGYTRIVKVGRRQGDAAPMSIIELVSVKAEKPKKKSGKKKATPKQDAVKAQETKAAPETEPAEAMGNVEAEAISEEKTDVAVVKADAPAVDDPAAGADAKTPEAEAAPEEDPEAGQKAPESEK